MKTYAISELSGDTLKAAIKEEREGEWNGKKSISKQAIIDFAIMNNTQYDKNGCFVSYGKKATV